MKKTKNVLDEAESKKFLAVIVSLFFVFFISRKVASDRLKTAFPLVILLNKTRQNMCILHNYSA